MFQQPTYWQEIGEYADELNYAVSQGEFTHDQILKDALFRSIGFVESLKYIQDLKNCKNPLRYTTSKVITERFLDQIKVRTRAYASYQLKSARSQNITKTSIQSCDKYIFVPNEKGEKAILECIEKGVNAIEETSVYKKQEKLMNLDQLNLRALAMYKTKHTMTKNQMIEHVLWPALKMQVPELF